MRVKRLSELTAALLIVIFLFLALFSHRQKLIDENEIKDYNEGWEYSFEGKNGEITLPEDLHVAKNTEVILSNAVPEDVKDDMGIVFRSRMQYVKVYVEDKLIYQYPEEDLIGEDIPSTWNFVHLSEEDAGKEIRICLKSPYSTFSGKMGWVHYGNYNDLVNRVMSIQTKVLWISLMVGIVGALMILIYILSKKHEVCVWQYSLGILLIDLCIWLCGESRMPAVFIGIEAWHYFTFLSLLFCPVFLTAYLYARWKDICGKITEILFYSCFAVGIISLISVMAGGPDLVECLPVTHLMIVITLGYTVVIYYLAARRKKQKGIWSELVCIGFIFCAGAWETVYFYSTAQRVAIWMRMAILLYALDLLRLSMTMIYRKVKENQKLEMCLKKSRAELMTSQIKPHFIYNTLNSIQALIKLDPDKARKMVYDFSTYLRSNLDNLGERELIPFSEELKHIQAYLNIEKIRFEERLNIVLDIRAKRFLVPPLSIQPLVENAVKHGLCKKIDGGTVMIRSYEKPDRYVVEVEDDGKGFDVSQLEKWDTSEQLEDVSSHIGLENIRFRIKEITGGTLEISSYQGMGTKVKVVFMKEKHPRRQVR